LLRPLVHGASRERSLTARKAYAAAAAAVSSPSPYSSSQPGQTPLIDSS